MKKISHLSGGPETNYPGTEITNEHNSGEVNLRYYVQADRSVYVDITGKYTLTDVVDTNAKSIGLVLKSTITKFYYAIRNIVLVVMMVILLYIGIRIMISSVSSEKAKYKNMLRDWLVAVCLVFIMHYIMIFAMNMVDAITDIFENLGNGDDPYINVYEVTEEMIQKLEFEYGSVQELLLKDESGNVMVGLTEDGTQIVNYLAWDAKNMVGLARIQAALCESGTVTYIGYAIVYLVLVFYTIFFLFTYIKRALYIAFFTIIAPLVAMTYPIDKIHDGKAQAFNIWLKEYIFNLMIQVVHLLLYTILISAAFELAGTNMIYSLVAIGFMMPAEKFVRKMFGFDKAQTPGLLGGAAGAALMMTGLNKLFHKKPSKGGKFIDDASKPEKEDKINMKDESGVDPYLLAGKSEKKSGTNVSNVLSNEEKARQEREAKAKEQKERKEMERLQENAQTVATPASEYINKNGNIGFDKSQFKNSEAAKQKEKMEKDQAEQQRKEQKEKEEREKRKKERQEKRRNSFVGRHGRALLAAGKTYGKYKAIRFGRSLATGKPIRKIAKTAGGLYLGATGALLGGTIGLASGEFKNVGQYAATAGAAGYALGAREPKSDPDVERAYKEYEREKYGNEEAYRKHLLEERRKSIISDENNLEQLRTYLQLSNNKEAKQYMEEYGDCIDAGITNMDDLAAIIKATETEGWDKNMSITAAKFLQKAGNKPKNMGKKDRENIEYQYRNIVKANGVTNEEDIQKQVQTMLSNLDKFGKIKDDLTQI